MTAGEVPNSERLQQIRDADAAAGEDLQMAPSAWRDRRDLLTLLTDREAALSAAVTALKVALSQWEPWEMRGWNLQKAGVDLVSQLEGTPFDPVAYACSLETTTP